MCRGILLAFVLTLAVFIGNAWFAIVNTRALVENEQRVVHTHEVLRQIEATLSTVRDAETAQRGYLLTGDESYLEGYRAAAARTAGDLPRLRELTRDDPAQQSRLDALDQQMARKFDLMAAAVEERRNRGLRGVVGRSPGGKAAMDEIRAVLTDMADDERVRLVARSDAAKVSAAWALLSFALATALALVAVVWEFNAVRRDFRRRERAAVD